MTDAVENVTFSVDGPDGSDEVEIPAGLVDLLSEEDDESMAQVVADIALMGFANRAHTLAHHGEGDASDELEAIEGATLDAFEERFGVTYGEATGHSH
ncbi:hypothetical protein J2752_000388 [Halarchaeum rubridurum]|uniref:Uncharacterized protein n=1 Tax=Halarchaeum rubridurum TaxID=489911 RepID=A0A830FYX6_9EURY|nr:hypothetical protein [Halarchaeum rubridurum]MBP1953507.1 hypothetical protein [Halarchaeum rubridurum]GGM64671.1 hypothetical protein GCM10009017_13520 [Halarchaeum rubridurum]